MRRAESESFGFNVLELVVGEVTPRELVSVIDSNLADIAILRLPGSEALAPGALDRLGYPFLIADMHLVLEIDVNSLVAVSRGRSLRSSEIADTDLPGLEGFLAEVLPQRRSHYGANPLFAESRIDAALRDLVKSYCNSPERRALIFEDEVGEVGLVLCDLEPSTGRAEVVAYGIRSTPEALAIHESVVRLTVEECRSSGMRTVSISSAMDDVDLQKALAYLGFEPLGSEAVVHVNACLSGNLGNADQFSITMSPEICSEYADTTGDHNPLHVSDSFAKDLGFEGAFAHGLIAGGVISEHYGNVNPGPGTVILKQSLIFKKPLYVGREYKFSVAFPIRGATGFIKSVVLVRDDAGICIAGYYDLYKRP